MAEVKQEGITVKKSENFSEWYTQVVRKSDFADYSIVSGCIVFKPDSYFIWEIVQKETDGEFKKIGIKNVYFPMFIPEKLLVKETEHLKGFSPEVAWVTQSGNTKLEERLAIRPTSETIMYDSYSKWIRSWRDLPLRLNQWNNVVRWEFKHPVPLLRSREFLWNEGHTVFATKKEAEAECDQIIEIYRKITEDFMALPCVIGRKTELEKFPGAEYSIALEFMLPNGKAVQGPDFHHDGQKFSKAFNIKFLNKNGKEEYAWQNTFAITTRMLGVMVAVHGDNRGLILPPRLASVQIVIIPILYEKNREKILKKAEELKKKLKDYRIEVDSREEFTAGWKFNHWELRGVPIRIEIGPKDIEKNQVVLVRRDTLEKIVVKTVNLEKEIKKMFDDIHMNLYKKAKKILEESIIKANNWEDFMKGVKNNKMVLAPFCLDTKCEEEIKNETEGVKAITIPFDQPKETKGKCLHCGKVAQKLVYFGRSY